MEKRLILAGRLIDGTGGVPFDGAALVVEGDRVVDVCGQSWWDCHVHLSLQHPFLEYRTDVEPVPYLTMRCYQKALEVRDAGVHTAHGTETGSPTRSC